MKTKLYEVRSEAAPAPVGPYSQAIEAGGFVFCSGMIALDPQTGAMVGRTAAEQAEQIMKNIRGLLLSAGCALDQIIKTTIFLTDMNEFKDVNVVYEQMLEGHKPARSTVGVASLPKGALCEIEVVVAK